MASDCTISLPDLLCSWEEDRKLVLRGWSLVFIFLATLLVFSVVDGRMAYVHGPYTGFIGLWIDCRRHKCANVGQFTVCRRLNKIDFIFSFLSIGIGLLILLSLTLFAIDCNRLRPRPQGLCPSSTKCGCGATVRLSWRGGSATSVGPRDTTPYTCSSCLFRPETWSPPRSCLLQATL
ncbi:uncharacterized protein 1700028J19Rikl isoform X11 [Rattus norvegicus]|uniref:uncharacterized protein 1700028J19Rikl isoform X11 n=1 Tax=Rattus norvegicus TaxID=10116 RepID=UPI002FD80AC7